MSHELFIGITCWNSEKFLEPCLAAIKQSCEKIDYELVVFDNCSSDDSVLIAESYGARVICRADSQANALSQLINESSATYTLLIHADVVLLNSQWFETVRSLVDQDTIMVAPEDIGCGLMSRKVGKGHPESSFMFFDTVQLKKFRRWKIVKRRFMVPLKVELKLCFDGLHLTHDLVSMFAKKKKKIHLMDVLYSNFREQPYYRDPSIKADYWVPALAHLEYGLGNFYAIDGMITHYHNWYERVDVHHYMSSAATTEPDNGGYPVEFVKAYTKRFLSDCVAQKINLPDPAQAPASTVIEQFSGSSNNE